MTAFAFVGTALTFLAVGLFGYAWIAAPEHRRLVRQRDRYRDLYARRTAEYVYLLRGGETPPAVDAAAAIEARRVLSGDEAAWETEMGA